MDLTEEEQECLLALATNLTENPSSNPEAFCEQAATLANGLPSRIKGRLTQFVEHGTPAGFLRFHVRIEPLEIPTPPNNRCHIGETTLLSKQQTILISAVSHPIAYEAECRGHLFQDVVPNAAMATQQTSLGSQTELEIHTEQAFSPLRPDLLSLSCLRGDPVALTYILPVGAIVASMTEEEQRTLREPLWLIGVDLSFKLDGISTAFKEGELRGPVPILVGPVSDPHLIFDQDLMRGTTVEAQRLLAKIVAIYYEKRTAYCLSPGDILIIDNRRAVHGRSPFHPKFDGTDRFLIRCFSVLDYDATRYARADKSCVVAAIYS